jgi:hypothetical protein
MSRNRKRVFLLPFVFGLAGSPLMAGPVLTNLAAWYEGNVGFNGTTWTDQSGNGHTATVNGSAPGTTTINGLQALSFNGQDLSISGQVLTDPSNYTIMAVITDATTINSGNTGFREVFSNWDSSNSTTSVFLGDTNVNPDNVRFTDWVGGADDTHGRIQQGEGTLTNPTSPFILSGISSSTDARIFQNGSLLFDNGAAIPARTLTTGYYIGDQGSFGGEFWNGNIAELLVYNGALNVDSFNIDVNYLTQKWLTPSSGVPEPATFMFLATGLAAIGLLKRRVSSR